MARLGHVRRHTTPAANTSLTAAALLSSVALMSAWVYAESLPLQVLFDGGRRSARAAKFSVGVRDLKNMDA